jgi:hypothetical protein
VKSIELTKEIFLRDIKNHECNILKDEGVYRHIHCRSPKTTSMWFDIITWPGYLAYTGDMGSYMFSRARDMFSFFRNNKCEINTDYWAEKCIAESIFGNGIREFSKEDFRENVIDAAKTYLDIDEKEKLPDDIIEEINPLLHCADEYECMETMRNFYSDKIKFNDFWEYTHQRKTWHYIWCCYAIVWGISKYDEIKTEPAY